MPGADADLLSVPVGPPLGTLPEVSYESAECDLPPGGVLLYYTDGLIERRHEPIDVGLARLRAAVTAEHPEMVCREVMRRLIGATRTLDDVALLAVGRVSAGGEDGMPRMSTVQPVPTWRPQARNSGSGQTGSRWVRHHLRGDAP